MQTKSRFRVIPWFALLLGGIFAPSLWAQGRADVQLDVSRQLFTMFCALRAGSPETILPASPVVARVDRALRTLDPGVTAPLRQFFQEKRFRGTVQELSAYISLALVLTGPPDFDFVLPVKQLPPDAFELAGLRPLLKDFYVRAELESLWRSVAFDYERALQRRRASLVRLMLETRGYLRLIGEQSLARSYAVYLDWLVPPNLISARNYGENYYLILHPQSGDVEDSVRHQYLHYLLDPLVVKHAGEMSDFAELHPLAAEAPRLPQQFREDALLLVGESLIQAVEVRLQYPAGRADTDEAARQAEITRREKDGFLFVRYFNLALEEFENAEPSIRFQFPEMLRRFPRQRESTRLRQVEFAPVEAVPAPLTAISALAPASALLAEAKAHVQAGDFAGARAEFERVLQEVDADNPSALYGLAILASAEGDRQRAASYFLRTLDQTQDPTISGWANIYLGRIYDLEGEREQAVAYYRAALAAGGSIERIGAAARRGLEQPYGDDKLDLRD